MKIVKVIIIASVTACMMPSLSADVPSLASGVFIKDSVDNLDVGYGAAPTVVDWNNDGIKDLIVGDRNSSKGNISIFLNEGTDEAPVFSGSSYIQSSGINITTYSGG